jgi:hypothetical protein
MMKTKFKSKRWLLGIGAILLFVTTGITSRVNRPTDESQTCQEYYFGQENSPLAPLAWRQSGEYFRWKSSLPQNASFEALNIFHTCQGNPHNPAILLIHGYPTSSPVARLRAAGDGRYKLPAFQGKMKRLRLRK